MPDIAPAIRLASTCEVSLAIAPHTDIGLVVNYRGLVHVKHSGQCHRRQASKFSDDIDAREVLEALQAVCERVAAGEAPRIHSHPVTQRQK